MILTIVFIKHRLHTKLYISEGVNIFREYSATKMIYAVLNRYKLRSEQFKRKNEETYAFQEFNSKFKYLRGAGALR